MFVALVPSVGTLRGEEANIREQRHQPDTRTQQFRTIPQKPVDVRSDFHLKPRAADSSFTQCHQHRDSTSTSASDSTDSSPTTTVSTMDSPSVTDPSPAPSPESPPSKLSASAFADLGTRSQDPNGNLAPSVYFELQRPTTPAKKARNLKNLAVNTANSTFTSGRTISTASLPLAKSSESPASAPSSPAFVKPTTPPRRRPNNLGLIIKTPANGHVVPPEVRIAIPPTPAFSRPNALRHFQSSPSLPLCSPRMNEQDGPLQPPVVRNRRTGPSGFAEVLQENDEDEQEENFDVPQSREEKPAAYPNGPICIYESGIFLFFEPTAEQAADYDVVLNVASEVKNPFLAGAETPRSAVEMRSAVSDSALSTLLQLRNSPSTPKQGPIGDSTSSAHPEKPEYIHIPWEHNTDIVPDLYRLVKLIDDRVQSGKRVLVHCQCGVSRSASLIVAYGLYKNPGISVQEAYDAVKKRSKWIGPNMNLIMQLQEFRAGLLKAAGDAGFYSKVFGAPRTQHHNTPKLPSIAALNALRSPDRPDTLLASPASDPPQSAPYAPEATAHGTQGGGGAAGIAGGITMSPGPSSAPSMTAWSPGFRRSWGPSPPASDLAPSPLSISPATPYVDTKGQLIPVVTLEESLARSPASSLQSGTPISAAVESGVVIGSATGSAIDGGVGSSSTTTTTATTTTATIAPVGVSASGNGVTAETNPFGLMSPTTEAGFPRTAFKRGVLDGQTLRSDRRLVVGPPRAAPTSHPSMVLPPATTTPRIGRSLTPGSISGEFLGANSSSTRSSSSSTPLRKAALRPKFSAPNLQEQYRLQRLQNDLEAKLPSRRGLPSSSSMTAETLADLAEALRSPRVAEFTGSLFHQGEFGILEKDKIERVETAEKERLVGEGKERAVEALKSPTTTTATATATSLSVVGAVGGNNPVQDDPRSPVVRKGISPITRNIWDFL